MDPGILLIWGPFLISLGIFSGFLAGLLGVGGGIVLVPGLFFSLSALGFSPVHMMHVAVGTSLAIIVPTGLSSARAHWKRHAVRLDLIWKIAPGILIGVLAGTAIADHISGETLKLIFAVALLCLAIVMLADSGRFSRARAIPRQPWPTLAGTMIGLLSTLIGIGGATISVPYMTFCRVSIHQAVGTASALGLAISIPATIGFIMIGHGHDHLPPFSLGYINLLAVALVVPGSVMAAPWGVHVAHKVSVGTLRRIFAVFVMIAALKMLYGAA
ncbi:MAG TPA: sulfite exporter TauE/SafE family protein [Micavibrio sp.]|jgi:uncharacterized membrane protein YfcA